MWGCTELVAKAQIKGALLSNCQNTKKPSYSYKNCVFSTFLHWSICSSYLTYAAAVASLYAFVSYYHICFVSFAFLLPYFLQVQIDQDNFFS